MPIVGAEVTEVDDMSRDYLPDIIAHRKFEQILTLVYECKILSNPWLAAKTDEARHVHLRMRQMSTKASCASSSSSSSSSFSLLPPLPPKDSEESIPGFAEHLHGTFLADAAAIRQSHGIKTIVEPGMDPQIDGIVHVVLEKYTRFAESLNPIFLDALVYM